MALAGIHHLRNLRPPAFVEAQAGTTAIFFDEFDLPNSPLIGPRTRAFAACLAAILALDLTKRHARHIGISFWDIPI
jgi:hypothetical protein